MPGLRFNGLTDYVELPDAAIFKPANPTIEVWFRYDGADGNLFMLHWNDLQMYIGSGKMRGALYNTSNGTVIASGTTALNPGSINHATVSYDGTNLIVYLNGKLEATASSPSIQWEGGTHYPTIGAQSSSYIQKYRGAIYSARIYSRALSASEVSANYAGTVTRTGLAGEWLFNEGQGTTALDTSGNGNNGTITGATWVVKASQQGLTFNGQTDVVTIPYTSVLAPTTALTIEIMAYNDNWPGITSGQRSILSKTEGGGYNLAINDAGVGYLSFALNRGPGYAWVVYPLTSLTSGWHHIVGTFDGRMQRLYIDGVSVGTPIDAGSTVSINYTISNALQIGSEASSGSVDNAANRFNGYLRNARIYSRALSSAEVSANYAGSVTRSGLVGEWLMQEGQGSTAFDTSGNGNNGTITGATWAVKSKARFNLLGVDGNCEDVSKLVNVIGVTSVLDSTNKVYGNNSIKYTLTTTGGYAEKDITALTSPTKYYLAAALVQNGNASTGIRIYVRNIGNATGYVYANYVTDSTKFNVVYVKVAPSDMANSTTRSIRVDLSGSSGQFAYVDGIRLYEISADEYNRIDVDPSWTGGTNIGALFPYTEAATPLSTLPAVNKTVRTGMRFNGISDYVSAPYSSGYNSNTITCEAWVNTTDTSTNNKSIIDRDDILTNRVFQFRLSGNYAQFIIFIGGTPYGTSATGNKYIPDGRWHHIVGVYDGSKISIYVDGVLDTVTGTISGALDKKSNGIFIGKFQGSTPSQIYGGSISAARIYNRSLSAAEVASNYAGNVTRSGLVGEWLLDHRYNGYALDTAQGATTVVGNLLPPFTSGAWTLHANAVANGAYGLTLNATASTQYSRCEIQVISGQTYVFSAVPSTNAIYILRKATDAGAVVYDSRTDTIMKAITVDDTYSGKIVVWLTNTATGTITYANPMLTPVDGTSAAFVPQTGNHGAVYGAIPAIRRATLKPKKNLLPTFDSGKWTLHANAVVNGPNSLTLNPSGTGYKDSTCFVSVQPNTSYTLSYTGTGSVSINKAVNNVATTNIVNKDGTFTGAVQFTTDSSTFQVQVDFFNGGGATGTFTYVNPMLELGSTQTTFETFTLVPDIKTLGPAVSMGSASYVSTDTTAPTAPTGLTATAASSSQINLSWNASTDNVGVTGYDVYRGASVVGSTTATSFSDTGLTASTSYSYTVKAKDAAGNVSAASSSASATTQASADTTAPSAPTGLTATAVSSSQINLSWAAATDNVGVTGYDVYRGSTLVGSNVNTTSYSDTGLAAGFTYSYTVKARDAAGNVSAASSAVNGTTQSLYMGAKFDGSTQYAEDGVIAWSGGFTVDMYIYHDASVNQDWNRIVQRGGDDGSGLAIRRYSTGIIFTNSTTSPNNAYVDLATGWHRIQCRYTGTAQEIWVDGIKATTSSVSDAPGSVGSQFTVGKKTGAAEYYWKGTLKNLRFWNRSLTDTEMSQLNGGSAITTGLKGEWFTTSFSGTSVSDTSGSGNTLTLYGGLGMDTGVPTTNLAVEYRLGDGSGQTAADSSGNGLNATLGSSTSVETADPAWTSYGLSFSLSELDVCNIPYNAAFDFSASSSVTIIALVKLTNTGSVQTYERRNGSLGWLQLRNRAGQPGNILCHNDAGTSVSANTARNQVSDTWDVLFGRINAGTMQARFNKESWGTSATASGTYTFASVGATIAPRDGNIAYFAYYNRALTDAECDKVYDFIKQLVSGRGITLT
jgi:chitodextrinase